MFFPESRVRVWLYTRPTDMRKSFDGLSALVGKIPLMPPPSIDNILNSSRAKVIFLYISISVFCPWAERDRYRSCRYP